MPIHDTTPLPNRRKWTRDEYNRAWQSGVFGETKVELLNGEILVESAAHAAKGNRYTAGEPDFVARFQ